MRWILLLFLSGCGGNSFQSTLSPSGPEAESIEKVFWFLTITLTMVFILTLILLYVALQKKEGEKPPGSKFIIGLGVLMPAVVVTVFLVYSLSLSKDFKTSKNFEGAAFKITVTGHQWWWEVEYPEFGIKTANELHIPKGKNIAIELRSNDVIHSFWVPALRGKLDAIPDHPNKIVIKADKTGIFRGQCAEFCGLQHAQMSFYVVSLEKDEFERWVEEKKRPLRVGGEQWRKGKKIFFEASCANCHAIKGTEAHGKVGPDLTYIGSRLSLGAGAIQNSHGALSGWIANPQALKPGNLMPPTYLSAEDLEALRLFLMELK